jgi:hypothetical protein
VPGKKSPDRALLAALHGGVSARKGFLMIASGTTQAGAGRFLAGARPAAGYEAQATEQEGLLWTPTAPR